MKKVLYEELLPEEFVQRMLEMPVAYLPLGTLEWHGPHMPLEADGIQSKELFQDYLRSIFAQLSRAGVRIVVGHGHGPSINAFQELTEEAEEKYGLRIFTAWTYAEDESNLIGIAGRHPVRDSSAAFGNEILEYTMKTLISGIEKEYKEIKDRPNLKNLHWLTKPMEIFYFLKQYLRIGSVKDIIMKSQFLQNGLHIFPIIIYIKFIAVSPDI